MARGSRLLCRMWRCLQGAAACICPCTPFPALQENTNAAMQPACPCQPGASHHIAWPTATCSFMQLHASHVCVLWCRRMASSPGPGRASCGLDTPACLPIRSTQVAKRNKLAARPSPAAAAAKGRVQLSRKPLPALPIAKPRAATAAKAPAKGKAAAPAAAATAKAADKRKRR